MHGIIPIETGSTSHGLCTVAFKVLQFIMKLLFHWHMLGHVQTQLCCIFVSVPFPAYMVS